MTERKSLKRLVRARMEKTGERYTAARRHVAGETIDEAPAFVPAHSDETVERATGRRGSEWFALLDEWNATERKFGEIARLLREEHGVSGWWSQTVAAEYERARGLRRRYERADGFSVGVSKTVAVPVDRLYAAFLEEPAWLPGGGLRVRTAQPSRSARFDWQDGRTRVYVGFEAKGGAKSVVALQHERLEDADEVERMRAFWRKRLAELKRLLEEGDRAT